MDSRSTSPSKRQRGDFGKSTPSRNFWGDGRTKPQQLAASSQCKASFEAANPFIAVHKMSELSISLNLLRSRISPEILAWVGIEQFLPLRLASERLYGKHPPGEFSKRAPAVDMLLAISKWAKDVKVRTRSEIVGEGNEAEEVQLPSPGSSRGMRATLERSFERRQAIDFSISAQLKNKIIDITKLLIETKQSLPQGDLLTGCDDTFQLATYLVLTAGTNWQEADYLGRLRGILLAENLWGLLDLETHGIIQVNKNGEIDVVSVNDAQTKFIDFHQARRAAVAEAAAARAAAAVRIAAAAKAATTLEARSEPTEQSGNAAGGADSRAAALAAEALSPAEPSVATAAAADAFAAGTAATASELPEASSMLSIPYLEQCKNAAETSMRRGGRLPAQRAKVDPGYYLVGRLFVQEEATAAPSLTNGKLLNYDLLFLLEVIARAAIGERVLDMTLDDVKRAVTEFDNNVAKKQEENRARSAELVNLYKSQSQHP